MNKLIYILSATVLIAVLAISGCKNDDADSEPDLLAQQLKALINEGSSWIIGSSGMVIKDGFDVSDQFNGFVLTISDGTYTTQNSLPHVWNTQGTWSFIDNNPNRILRDDDVEISVQFNANTLTLTFFSPDSNNGGKVESVEGEFQFVLNSQ